MLFLLYINDMPRIAKNSTVDLFADDAKCSRKILNEQMSVVSCRNQYIIVEIQHRACPSPCVSIQKIWDVLLKAWVCKKFSLFLRAKKGCPSPCSRVMITGGRICCTSTTSFPPTLTEWYGRVVNLFNNESQANLIQRFV